MSPAVHSPQGCVSWQQEEAKGLERSRKTNPPYEAELGREGGREDPVLWGGSVILTESKKPHWVFQRG